MAIDPMKSGSTPAFDAVRGAQQGAQVRGPREADAADPKERAAAGRTAADQVQLSPESRGLVARATEAPAPVEGGTAAGLSSERLKQVLERVQEGFYDRADVRDVTARGILKDLGTE